MSVHVSRDELDYERFVAWIVIGGKIVAVGDGQDEQDAKEAAFADLIESESAK